MSTTVESSVRAQVAEAGYAFAPAEQVGATISADEHLPQFLALWDDLEPDNYLQGDYVFRRRRYSQVAFVPAEADFKRRAQVAYAQSEEINSYAGGIERVFAPVTQEAIDNPVFRGLISSSFDVFDVPAEYRSREWTVEVHMFRLLTRGATETHPTPEGIHRDGVPMGALHMIGRKDIEGGVSHVYSMERELLAVSTLRDPLDSFYAWDNRVMHYATPLFATGLGEGHRDVLVYGFHLAGTKYERA